jgi:hypothetical protein
MLGLYYAPGACSMAAHIVLEESGEKYEPIQIDLAKGEQRSDANLTQFGLWPSDAVGEAKLLSLIGYFVAAVHPAYAHVGRPERYLPTSPRCGKRVSKPFTDTSRISTRGSPAESGSLTATRLSISMASSSTHGARVASCLSGN